jgi:hypothetical protein
MHKDKISKKELDEAKILKFNLKTEPFMVMVTGEKTVEYRDIKPWMNSRLFDKEGNPRTYDFVKFTLAFGNNKPYFICRFNGFEKVKKVRMKYSNGFEVKFDDERWGIRLGEIVMNGNL